MQELSKIHLEKKILVLRDTRVMLDADLALLYGVSTKRLNEQVKRNLERFPQDFMFRLTLQEKEEVVAICDHLQKLKFSSTLPLAFSEHGAIMLANVLKSPQAVDGSIQVVRAFIRLRQFCLDNRELLKKIEALESRYNSHFKVVFEAIRELMQPKSKDRKAIGFL